ncbi:tetratricopeptide repeat protein [bacterium]|nr:tetratricopeptide repeat protein [bacterium]
MRKGIFVLIILTLVAAVLSSCATKKTEEEYLTLITDLTQGKEFGQAIKYYEELIRFYPQSVKIDEYKGKYLDILVDMSYKGTDDEQEEYLEKVVEVFPDSEDPRVIYSAFRLAKMEEAEDPDEARVLYQNLKKDGLNELAKYLIGESEFEDALLCYQKIMELFPGGEDEDKSVFMIGYIYGEYLNNIEKAKDYFQIVIDKYPDSELRDDAEWMHENVGKPLEEIIFEEPIEGVKDQTSTASDDI